MNSILFEDKNKREKKREQKSKNKWGYETTTRGK